MSQHAAACADIVTHVERVFHEEIQPSAAIPSLDDLARRELDNFRAEQLGLDPEFRAVVERIREETIARMDCE